VQAAIEEILANKGKICCNPPDSESAITDALNLPTDLQYRALLQGLRFDYMDMKQGEADFKHHYKSTAAQNKSPPQTKMVRLAQELADLSNALPSEHTNSVFVRVEKTRVDMMKSLITGAIGTPYAHGCYEFDIFCENSYPNGPPKMNLMTTGGGQIRFNPNLYACGKVCLSLLGTWRGNATENWDAKLSTILQVLLSTQAIIMSEEVYFNEPGFENEAGTVDGEKRNEGYMNIVRYGNVKYAMLGQIRKPSKGFETVILRHFYVKKAEILTDVHKWVERADKVEAMFTGLVSDHNHNIAKEFQKSKTKYREMLAAVVKELEDELHKLDKPTNYQLRPKAVVQKKTARAK
jgi:ubiquitin-protein ligase